MRRVGVTYEPTWICDAAKVTGSSGTASETSYLSSPKARDDMPVMIYGVFSEAIGEIEMERERGIMETPLFSSR